MSTSTHVRLAIGMHVHSLRTHHRTHCGLSTLFAEIVERTEDAITCTTCARIVAELTPPSVPVEAP